MEQTLMLAIKNSISSPQLGAGTGTSGLSRLEDVLDLA
jgi:hypothetical protein